MATAKKFVPNKKRRKPAHETNPDLAAPDYPPGHVETIEEFIARGGKITKCAPYKDPNPFYVNDGPRPSLAEYMKRKKYHV